MREVREQQSTTNLKPDSTRRPTITDSADEDNEETSKKHCWLARLSAGKL